MIPLRDDTERLRAPALAAVLAAAALLGALAVLVTGGGGWTALLLAVDAGALWVFGAGVEGAVGRLWFAGPVLAGAIGGAAIALAAGAPETAAVIGAAAATGAAFEGITTHAMRLRGSRVMGLAPIPAFAGMREAPAGVWGLVWGAVVIVLLLLGALGG